MQADFSKQAIQELYQAVDETVSTLNIDAKKSRIGELQTISAAPDFWENQDSAKKQLQELESLRQEVETAEKLVQQATSLKELAEQLSETEFNELEEDFHKLLEQFNKFETLKFLSGKYDQGDAILTINAGQGGTEANDWAEMIYRMYQRYCERKGWKVEIENIMPGTEVGISTVTLFISGPYAFGLLKNEHGVHRLVRVSPFNAQGLRQTSFAGVEVTPVIENDDEIEIKDSDIEFKAVRSGGAGGQHVNKTSSAVQITHIPSGITVHNSEQRSQHQNREAAMRILRSKLWQLKQEEQSKEMSQLKGDHRLAGWGNQTRNYVLHPYKLVKDLKTGVETANPDSVLDGGLDLFVEAATKLGYTE